MEIQYKEQVLPSGSTIKTPIQNIEPMPETLTIEEQILYENQYQTLLLEMGVM